MHVYLKKLVDERNALAGLMQQLSESAAADDRGLAEAEQERQRGWQKRCAELDREITDQNEYLKQQRDWAKLQSDLSLHAAEEAEQSAVAGRGGLALASRSPGRQSGSGGLVRSGSWGSLFTESAQFKNYDGTGSSGRVEVPSLFDRAPIDTTYVDTQPYIFNPTPWVMTTPLLDAINRETVSNGNVEWISWPGAYPEAGEVAEGAAKPEADFAPIENAAALKTVAHWKGITRQALDDIPRIQAIIEGTLRGGVLRKLESSAAAALTSNAEIATEQTTDLLAGIRVAIGTVESNGYARPNVILLNPSDFAELDISVMGGTVSGPQRQQGFWGVQAIGVGAIPVGDAYVGDLKTGLTLFERGAASLYLTDSHSDYFIRNILVLLAETRALPVVTEPQAIVKVTTTVGP